MGWGWYFNGYLKTRTAPRTLPHPKFGTGMENNYIFWDENGIGGARPKPALFSSLNVLYHKIRSYYGVYLKMMSHLVILLFSNILLKYCTLWFMKVIINEFKWLSTYNWKIYLGHWINNIIFNIISKVTRKISRQLFVLK